MNIEVLRNHDDKQVQGEVSGVQLQKHDGSYEDVVAYAQRITQEATVPPTLLVRAGRLGRRIIHFLQ